jgi:hypothetical protein
MKVRRVLAGMVIPLIAWLALGSPAAAQTGNVARIVVWQMKPGLDRDFQEGYKRHLQWHRDNHDTWTWRGWILGSGDRVDYFVDGTFFHAWSDFDSPVNPAGDGANNELNVYPYADVRALATYEVVPALSNLQSDQLGSPQLTFLYIQVPIGKSAEFEAALQREVLKSQTPRGVLRPVNGATEYLLLLPFAKSSEMEAQGEFIARLLESLARNSLVVSYHTEAARYHPELSNVPGQQ